jgi:glycosyltransferase involved in cell wall biosynthesis
MTSWSKMITRTLNVETKSENIPDLAQQDYVSQKYDSITRDDVTIIIPTLNEEEAISNVLNDVLTNGYNNVLVVDGFSTDNTVSIVKKHGVRVVEQKGVGKTGAVKMALEHVTTPYFVLMDGDCTYRAKDIEQFFPLMKNKQLVIGSRAGGRENISHLNRFGNWGINKIFNVFFDTNLSDVCSGLYMLDTEFARNIPFKTEGFDVEVEIAAYTARNGVIVETCIDYYPRLGQQKLRPFHDGVKIISTVLRQARTKPEINTLIK